MARLGLDKSTVSRQVSHLVDLGLVDRAADPVDGRAQVLTPSAEGVGAAGPHPGGPPGPVGDRPGGLAAPTDVARLGELLARLNRLGEAREAEVEGASAESGPARR